MRGHTRYRVPMLRPVVAAMLLGLALATSASAGEPTETLRTLFDRANRILLSSSDSTDDTRLTALRALVSTAFDAREAAALALGREWQARTPAERDEFSRLYADAAEGAYLGGVGSRARVHADDSRRVRVRGGRRAPGERDHDARDAERWRAARRVPDAPP